MSFTHHNVRVGVVVAGVAMVVVSCGHAPKNFTETAEPATITPSSVATTSAQARPEPGRVAGADGAAARQVKETYLAMWHQFTIAAASANQHASGLSAHATGAALVELRQMLYADSMAGRVTLGKPDPNPQITAVRIPEVPLEVDLLDCVNTSNWRKYKARDGQVDAVRPDRILASATARNSEGTWKIATLSLREVDSC
ncbi:MULTISPECIES: hypothetical protein [unclassified Crossiella]|uniref:hypothetical protein n=1 Tax=unclassified Crossiella TaxID=2620835 RepID=UPI001FFF02BB|nr:MULTISPECIES: hypothetical protein [unclassified Crossiella]MCK2241873.1 hypothetical protein [Crossiella sp. S99.2]MCK2255776.1 hypothetical protein [Crossiella sp. S99.1]